MRCRILIVDDHEVVRRGIRTLLSARSDWEICAEASDGLEAIEKAKALRPDVILMDIFMPRMNGLDATRLLHLEIPNSKVIIVSQNDPRIVREQAHAIGAAAYVVKSDLAEKLVTTIDQVIGAVPGPSSAPAQPTASQSATGAWLAGGGRLGQLIREYDWSKTPLGALDHWPQSLRTSVNLMLNSRHPMWIGWGPEMTFLYNDAYVAVLSQAKHPQALGRSAREVWSEIWDICGPLADKVFERGEATFVDDVRLFMSRGDVLEETYYSFSYSPIHDESGRVAGLFCPSTDTTAKNLNGRRLGTLSELAANAVVEKSTEAACASSFTTLARNPNDVPFALLYLLDETHGAALLKQSTGISSSIERASPPSIDLKSELDPTQLWKIREVLNSCQPQRLSLASLDSVPFGPAQQPVKEAILLPVTSSPV
jgi:CheY-like chemotaxis protein